MSAMSEDIREQARKRIQARRDFWQMLAVFGGIIVILVVIWAATGAGYFWPMWPIFGLAIATIFTALNAFGPFNRPITDAHIDEEVRKLGGSSGS